MDAVRAPHKTIEKCRLRVRRHDCASNQYSKHTHGADDYYKLGKNPGDVWEIPTQPFPEVHFATFPEKLVEPMILAGCPQWICKKCGKAKARITKTETDRHSWGEQKKKIKNYPKEGRCGDSRHQTVGWTDCGCKNLTCTKCNVIVNDKEVIKYALQIIQEEKGISKEILSRVLDSLPG